MLVKKNVFITGAAKRIGAEISKSLSTLDCNVVIHYNKSSASAKKLCREINKNKQKTSNKNETISEICFRGTSGPQQIQKNENKWGKKGLVLKKVTWDYHYYKFSIFYILFYTFFI